MDILFFALLFFGVIYQMWPRSLYRVGMLVNVQIPIRDKPNLQMLITRQRWVRTGGIKIERYYDGTVLIVQDGEIAVSTYIWRVEESKLNLIKGLE